MYLILYLEGSHKHVETLSAQADCKEGTLTLSRKLKGAKSAGGTLWHETCASRCLPLTYTYIYIYLQMYIYIYLHVCTVYIIFIIYIFFLHEYRTKLGRTKVVLRGSWSCHHCKTDKGPPYWRMSLRPVPNFVRNSYNISVIVVTLITNYIFYVHFLLYTLTHLFGLIVSPVFFFGMIVCRPSQ